MRESGSTAGPIEAFQGFVEALRSEGIRVSTSETLEAFRALEAVDLADRGAVRCALRLTLAKTCEDRERFDRTFDRYFAPPAGGGRGRGKGRRTPRPGEEGAPRRAAGRPGQGGAVPPEAGGKAERRPRKAAPSSRQAAEDLLSRIRQRALKAGRTPPRIFLSRAPEEHGRQRGRGATGPADLPRTPLKGSRLQPVTREEDRALEAAVPGLLTSLPPSPIRRTAPAPRGTVWLRRTMRESLKTGGVPFDLPRRAPRLDGPIPLLLVDVSHSVRRAAGLFLRLSARVLQSASRARVFLFVDRPVDVTAGLRSWLRGSGGGDTGFDPFLARLESEGRILLDAPSDYGTAFHRLLNDPSVMMGPRTSLVVLGDGRTNRFDPLPWAFEELAGRCGRTLWVAPETHLEWGTGDSALEAYLPSCDVVLEAREILDLGRAVSTMENLPSRTAGRR